MQQGLGYTALQAGYLSITYLIMVLLMIRVGEKLLQKMGSKRLMLLNLHCCGHWYCTYFISILTRHILCYQLCRRIFMFRTRLRYYASTFYRYSYFECR